MTGEPLKSTDEVRQALLGKQEIALIDVGEEAIFAEAHPLFAACLPFSRLELEIFDRIPRRSTEIVVYDSGGRHTERAMQRLVGLGYTNVSALAGGLDGWRRAGCEIFQDVNAPSKAFGELVEARKETPSLPAPDLHAMLKSGARITVLDARPFAEYHTMSIPGGTNVPGGELVHRLRDLVPDSTTTVVVNCAGRTRSIIGAQSLLNAGVPNPVYALRNGTIGWLMEGQTLEHGQTREAPPSTAEARRAFARQSRDLADRAGVRRLGLADLETLDRTGTRTVYRFDVRTPDEFETGHLPRFRSAPGGQLVQEMDVFAPVRGARVMLYGGEGPRADMTGSWLAQMGWETYVLGDVDPALARETGAWAPTLPPLPEVAWITPEALSRRPDCRVIDLGASRAFQQGHIPGAWFAVRGQLLELSGAVPIVLTSEDGRLAAFAANDIAELTDQPINVLKGGTIAWRDAGLPMERGLERLLTPVIDRYRRPYEGTDNPAAAMQAYLDWEFGLVEQLRRDGTHGFLVV